MDIYPTIMDTKNPIQSIMEIFRPFSNKSRTIAPRRAGMPIINENSAASFLGRPSIKDADIVMPALEIPGSIANICTHPINNARAGGLLFDKTALLFLSLSPQGMEDLTMDIRTQIEQFAKKNNYFIIYSF